MSRLRSQILALVTTALGLGVGFVDRHGLWRDRGDRALAQRRRAARGYPRPGSTPRTSGAARGNTVGPTGRAASRFTSGLPDRRRPRRERPDLRHLGGVDLRDRERRPDRTRTGAQRLGCRAQRSGRRRPWGGHALDQRERRRRTRTATPPRRRRGSGEPRAARRRGDWSRRVERIRNTHSRAGSAAGRTRPRFAGSRGQPGSPIVSTQERAIRGPRPRRSLGNRDLPARGRQIDAREPRSR